jgi:hypothetical protein
VDLIKGGWEELKRLSKDYKNGQELATHESGHGVPFIDVTPKKILERGSGVDQNLTF